MSDHRRRRSVRAALSAVFALVALAALPAIASAATVTVNTTADNAPAPGQCEGVAGDCSLRQAIDVANGEPGPNKVVVPAGDYALTIEPTGGTDNDSGDLDVSGEVTIEGAGARHTTIDASAIEDRALTLLEGNLHLVGLTVTGGHTEGSGGGILLEASATLQGVTVTDNESFNSASGGGIAVESGANLTIADSTLSDNRTSGDGGGLAFYGQNLTVENSTIANNTVETALNPTDSGYGAYGGGLEAYGENLAMKNVTIAGNHIVDNNGGERGAGAGIESEFDTYEVVNTIIADNTAAQVNEPGQCSDEAPIPSLGHNLESAEPAGEPRCFEAPTDLMGEPQLAALGNNGGETDTMAIGPGSPALDAGNAALCLPTDQRGVARPYGSGCDIGAYEYHPVTPVVTPLPAPAATPVVSGKFEIKQAKRDPAHGTVKLGVKFNLAGTLKITGKGLKTVKKSVTAGLRSVTLTTTGATKAKLAKTGKAKVKVTISFKTATNTFTRKRTLTFLER